MGSQQCDEISLIDCNEKDHANAILELFNDAIVNSTALYDYHPRAPEFMQKWFAAKRAHQCLSLIHI